MFTCYIENKDLKPWQLTTYNRNPSINLSNLCIPLVADVDPTGWLAALPRGNLFHSEDNVVLYCTKLNNSKQ